MWAAIVVTAKRRAILYYNSKTTIIVYYIVLIYGNKSLKRTNKLIIIQHKKNNTNWISSYVRTNREISVSYVRWPSDKKQRFLFFFIREQCQLPPATILVGAALAFPQRYNSLWVTIRLVTCGDLHHLPGVAVKRQLYLTAGTVCIIFSTSFWWQNPH